MHFLILGTNWKIRDFPTSIPATTKTSALSWSPRKWDLAPSNLTELFDNLQILEEMEKVEVTPKQIIM